MSTETVLVTLGIVFEAALVALLWWKRAYRHLPVFCAYILWGLASDCAMSILQRRFPAQYLTIYLVEVSLDSLFQYGVLVELAWSVLQPFRNSLPRRFLWGISLAILVLAAIAWPFSTVQGAATLSFEWLFVARIQQTFAALRILAFLALAGGCHALSIGWRDRELQVATGLGIYSLVSMVGTVVHTHQAVGTAYRVVDLVVAGSFLISLVYWLISFSQKERPRREFTPQMQELLHRLAGEARSRR